MTPTQEIAHAEDALRRGEYETAVRGFANYLAGGQETFRARAFFELAQAQFGLQNYASALDTLADFEDQYPEQNWPQIPALRGDIAYAVGNRVEAIRQWDLAWNRGTNTDRQFLRNRIAKAIAELTPTQAADLAGELQRDEVRAVLAERFPAVVTAIPPAAPQLPEKIATPGAYYPAPETESPFAEEAANLGTLPPAQLGIAAGDALAEGLRLGCVLPLSGPNRGTGKRVRTGLRRAFAGSPDFLMVRDGGDDSDRTAELTVAMINDPTVIALISPARGSAAESLALLVDRLQMPLLFLARSPGVEGPYVFALDSGSADTTETGSGDLETTAYDAGMLMRRALAQGVRTRGAMLQFLRAQGQQ